MPITDYDEYVDLLRLNRGADFQMSGAIGKVNRPAAMWRLFVPAPANPTTSVALDKTSEVSLAQVPNSSTGKLAVLGGRLNTGSVSSVSMTVVDLLTYHGGMDATVTSEQTTNLPGGSTAPLPRHTSGAGVMIGLMIHQTGVGSTATTVTVKYTNQAGTANRVSTATSFGGTGFRETSSLILIPLQAGDTGARSVEGVTLAATTGAVGNFGVVLFKPLTVLALESTTGAMPIDAITGGMVGAMQSFDDNACLSCFAISTVNQALLGALLLGEV